MLVSTTFITNYLASRQFHLYLRGNSKWLNSHIKHRSTHTQPIHYESIDSVFWFDYSYLSSKQDKLKSISFIDELTKSTNIFYRDSLPKLLCLLYCDNLPMNILIKLKLWTETRYQQCRFLFHSQSKQLTCLLNRCLFMQIPPYIDKSKQLINSLFYKRWLKIFRDPISSTTLSNLRELCYMYHLQSEDSTPFQKYLVKQIGSNEYLPNPLKYKIVHDITYLNHLYQTSYRKSLYLEAILYSVFKHLQHYKTNL